MRKKQRPAYLVLYSLCLVAMITAGWTILDSKADSGPPALNSSSGEDAYYSGESSGPSTADMFVDSSQTHADEVSRLSRRIDQVTAEHDFAGGSAAGTVSTSAAKVAPAPLLSSLSMEPSSQTHFDGQVDVGELRRRLEAGAFDSGDRFSFGARLSTGARYLPIDEIGFQSVETAPLSTFSIDVDTASYTQVRQHLSAGAVPPFAAVRIEELVNWFDYAMPEPTNGEAFSRTVEIASCPWRPENRLVRIALRGRAPVDGGRKPANLVFLLDVSGSMSSSAKLPLLKLCMEGLVRRLNEGDHVSIVTYANEARTLLPSARGHETERLLEAIGTLSSGGSTNGAGGIQLAYDLARDHFIEGGINRVILATDGDFNVGISDRGELTKLIQEKAKSGVFLSCLGFGGLNYRDDVMKTLASKGNGHYAFVDSVKEGSKVLGRQLDANLEVIAKDVKIQVEFHPARVSRYRLIGYEHRRLAARDFNDDTKDAGEIGAGHMMTALYELEPAGQHAAGAGTDPLRYQRKRPVAATEGDDELLTLKVRYKAPEASESRKLVTHVKDVVRTIDGASEDLRFAAAVTWFGLALRAGLFDTESDLDGALRLASGSLGEDALGQRAEFIDLVRRARQLCRPSVSLRGR